MLSLVRVLVVASLALVAALAIVSCKQEKGDRCQVKDDCASPLICTTLGFCGTPSENPGVDAAIPDARPDAMEPIDGGPDANLPDANLPDANLPDANLPDAT